MTGHANGWCRRCLKPVIWARTEAHSRPLPLDPEPDEAGNQAVFRDKGEVWRTRQLSGDDRPYSFETRYMPHLPGTTCKPPEAVVTPLRPPPANVIPITAARSVRDGTKRR